MDDPSFRPQAIDPLGLPAHKAVAVYLLELDLSASRDASQRYLPLLTELELAHWQAIQPPSHRWQYLQSRALQRLVLGAYAGCDPQQLAFRCDRQGRSRLAVHGDLYFSLAQCASHVALAVGSDPVLGIDVKTLAPTLPSFMRIARQFFHADDLAQLRACPEGQRYHRFLELWTLKEAYVKALGLDIDKPLADCGFERTAAGLIAARDRAPARERVAPDGFIAQRRLGGCQLALAYRCGRPVRFRYLKGLAWQRDQAKAQGLDHHVVAAADAELGA